ncbi:ferritin-like domain-containing protein [Furfurilactobacillus rossiae]|nr:ferritin-like domain-containing protein [Furfurilactobacillus rossiae]QFR66983.1 DNA starvation/stationary phase protection protein [Furfurilactobacillus rossiae]QLE62485.1 Non-specific DNA-binding protein Dps - Iron-binding ferritin-like antioxidant protein - Ferroxidase [Furfurilactobacillus rossiae]
MTTAIEDRYQAELKQSDIDHHTPTAGAMAGHIVANLVVLANKLQQAKWYVKGPERFSLKPEFNLLMKTTQNQRDELGERLLAEGEIVPSTTSAFTEYAMLEEAGQNKYQTASWLVNNFVHDFETNNLFVTRAIKLSEKEDRPALTQYLTTLLFESRKTIADLQAYLGNDARTGLDDEDDDDED